MAKIGELLVEINGDNSGLNKTLKTTESSLMGAVGKMTGAIGLMGVAWKAIDLAMQGIDYNKAAEQAEIAFGVFLGSAGAAKDMIEELRDLAKETPLEFAEVRDAAKRLSAFGIEADKVVPAMRRLADVSAGLQIPIGDLAYLFGTIKTQGKAMTVDINQFANRGIPIWEELAKVTGKAGTELRKLVEEGGVGFPQIEQAFANMTNEGGKFFEMAKKQMDSLAGSQSNLNDAFDVWLGQVTSGLTGPLKDLNNWAADWLNNSTELLKKNGKEWEELSKYLGDRFGGLASSTRSIRDDFLAIAQHSKMSASDTSIFLDKAEKIEVAASRFAGTSKDAAAYITKLSEQSGITRENIANIMMNSDKVSKSLKSGAAIYLDQNNLTTIGKQTQEQLAELTKKADEATQKRIAADKLAAETLAKKNAEQAKVNKALADEAQLYRDNSVTYLQFIDLERQRQILAKETPADLEKLATAEQIVSGYRLAAFAAEFEAMRLATEYDTYAKDVKIQNMDELIEKYKVIGSAVSDSFAQMGTTMGESIGKQQDMWKSLAGAAIKAIAQIIRAMASGLTAQVTQLTATAIANAVAGNLVGAAAATGGAITVGAQVAGIYALAGFVDSLASYANGTDFARGGLSLVGEKGPELVNLPRGSQVKTAEETSRMMGSSNATIELYLDSKIIAESTVKLIDNGRVRLRSLAG